MKTSRVIQGKENMENLMRIKGMVCRRCISTVKDIFMEEGFNVNKIDLGEVVYTPKQSDASLDGVKYRLVEEGFQPLDDKQSQIIAKVKELVEEHLSGPEHHTHNFSQMVTESIFMDYDSISSLFTATEGITLERYLIGRRIEKAKGLLQNTKLSFTDIAFQLGYSSVHHFSNQFKNITGLTPSAYRKVSVA
jgi:AraC family transcriptional regulator